MPDKLSQTDVLIIGAGAAGLMCAIEAGKRGRKVIVLDHANKAGKKILMSGGGRCNFTNLAVDADNFISHNPHFCKSALSRYTQWDFIAMVEKYHVPYHERDRGKLFCLNRAKDILNMLLSECDSTGAEILLRTEIQRVDRNSDGSYFTQTSRGNFNATSLVIASGGLSIPKMCATPVGYNIARKFGHHIWPTSAGLVPFTLQPEDKEKYQTLSGIAVYSLVGNERCQFKENILFTHRGLSGPGILQISSYWRPGEIITINLSPDIDIQDLLVKRQQEQPGTSVKKVLGEILPKQLLITFLGKKTAGRSLQSLTHDQFSDISRLLHCWQIKPNATEGYRTAEVTLGGVDCDELSSKTMESRKSPGLYFIGEVIDVTGWLGGYNFQWAWSSGWCAGQVV